MNAQRLIELFDRICDAPDAIPRLRRFIIDLAVRGKLVRQNPNDEPASELLRRYFEKRNRQQESARTKNRSLYELGPIVPYEIPKSWVWIQLRDVTDLITKGSTPTSYGHQFVEAGINFIKVESIKNGLLLRRNITSFITEETHQFLKRSQLFSGDFLFSIAGSIGTSAVVPDEVLPANTNQALAIIRGTDGVFSSRFLKYCLDSSLVNFALNKARGGAMNNISLQDVGNFFVCLPPINEQNRIVAKLDELILLINNFKEKQEKKGDHLDRVVFSTLNHLTNGVDQQKFRDHARFYINHLSRLASRPEHIQQLRQTILDLAVRGKLVPHDPNDEPAWELLEKINNEKGIMDRLKKKTAKQNYIREPLEIPFSLPSNWTWARLNDICLNITDGFHSTPHPTMEGRPYITAKHIRPGRIDFRNCLYVDEKNHRELFAKTKVRWGDVLVVNIGAGCGTPAIVDVEYEFSFKNVAILNLPTVINNKYVFVFLLSLKSRVIEQIGKGGAQPFLGLSMLKQILIPVPPMKEQDRIAARINELNSICDSLEQAHAETQCKTNMLFEALLNELNGNVN